VPERCRNTFIDLFGAADSFHYQWIVKFITLLQNRKKPSRMFPSSWTWSLMFNNLLWHHAFPAKYDYAVFFFFSYFHCLRIVVFLRPIFTRRTCLSSPPSRSFGPRVSAAEAGNSGPPGTSHGPRRCPTQRDGFPASSDQTGHHHAAHHTVSVWLRGRKMQEEKCRFCGYKRTKKHHIWKRITPYYL